MRKIIFYTTLFISLTCFTQETTNKRKAVFPVGTFHNKNEIIYGLSLGLYSHLFTDRNVISNGLRIEVPGIGFLTPIGNGSPISEITTLKNTMKYKGCITSEIVNGINVSSGSWGEMKYNGITLGMIAQHGRFLNGIGLAGIWNAFDKANGISASILLNESLEHNGIQISISNTTVILNGIQAGIGNHIYQKGRGIQIGLFNTAENFKGIQIGL